MEAFLHLALIEGQKENNGGENVRKKLLAVVAVCLAVLLSSVEVQVVFGDPIVPSGSVPLGAVVAIFLVTVAVEACGIYFLLIAFKNVKEQPTRRQCVIIALVLNAVTFVFGNYILLPILTYVLK